MITPDGWCTFATRIPGIPDKIYSAPNTGIGFACHSVVGAESPSVDGVPDRFLSTEKTADGRYTAYAAASCVFVLRQNGELIQMYPITASTWTSGGREGNTNYIPMELEGGQYPQFDEPMTDAQVASFVLLVRDLETAKGIKYVPGENMLEHRQIAEMYGYAPTSCASGRYARGWAALTQEDNDMELLARVERLELIVAGFGINTEDGTRLTGNDALEYAWAQQLSAFLSIQNQNAALSAHTSPHPIAGYTEAEIERIAVEATIEALQKGIA